MIIFKFFLVQISGGPPSNPATPLNNNLDLLADFGDMKLGQWVVWFVVVCWLIDKQLVG